MFHRSLPSSLGWQVKLLKNLIILHIELIAKAAWGTDEAKVKNNQKLKKRWANVFAPYFMVPLISIMDLLFREINTCSKVLKQIQEMVHSTPIKCIVVGLIKAEVGAYPKPM